MQKTIWIMYRATIRQSKQRGSRLPNGPIWTVLVLTEFGLLWSFTTFSLYCIFSACNAYPLSITQQSTKQPSPALVRLCPRMTACRRRCCLFQFEHPSCDHRAVHGELLCAAPVHHHPPGLGTAKFTCNGGEILLIIHALTQTFK